MPDLWTKRTQRRMAAVSMVLLQLVAASALPSADALLEAGQVGLPLHVESEHNEDCPASHDHLICQVVRSLEAASASEDVVARVHVDPSIPTGGQVAVSVVPPQRPSLRGPTTPRPPPLG